MRPRGMPPTPIAASRLIAPVEIASTRTFWSAPRRMIEPLPQLFSICAMARFNAFFLSSCMVDTAIALILSVSRRPFWPFSRIVAGNTGRFDARTKYETGPSNSSGISKLERIGHVTHPDAFAFDEHTNDIESVGIAGSAMTVDPD